MKHTPKSAMVANAGLLANASVLKFDPCCFVSREEWSWTVAKRFLEGAVHCICFVLAALNIVSPSRMPEQEDPLGMLGKRLYTLQFIYLYKASTHIL